MDPARPTAASYQDALFLLLAGAVVIIMPGLPAFRRHGSAAFPAAARRSGIVP
jgi:hypothetical protein